jgi:hypothetical protein
MSTGGIITVTGGHHAGASVLLSDGHDLSIGSGDGVSLLLVDDGVASHHATVCLVGNRLKLTALHEGVSVFGYQLVPGKATMLVRGASFTLGDARFQFSGSELLTQDIARHAELAWLRTHAPLAYIAKRWAQAPRTVKLLLLILLGSAGVGSVWQLYGSHGVGRALPCLGVAFRFVTVHEDVKTRAYIYEGYVMTSSDLALLGANARRDTRMPVMRVIVIEQMREQLADFLQKYYRSAQIEPAEPGSFTVTPPSEDAYIAPESWDYRRIARLARESVNGLRDLRFKDHIADKGPVRLPLEAIGMNLARSAHGAWLVDEQGGRYFSGARVPLGRIASISACAVKIIRNDDGTTYELFADGAEDMKKCD